MKIGEKIKLRRKELKWSQRDLAEKMGYNHSTITRIETGKIDIPQSRIMQFADVLHTDIAYLMDWNEDQKEKPAQEDELSENIKKLVDFVKTVPDDKAELVLKLMRTIVEDD
ncbi:MAG: helix-turn-helix transcriptional regulator [Clostridia bacterium]|nr:helix-turn-helix transcriptional regulator [Clostridia bacterium]